MPHQIVLSKADAVLHDKQARNIPGGMTLERAGTLLETLELTKSISHPPNEYPPPGTLGEIISFSAETPRPFGISHIRWAIIRAAGLDAGTSVDQQRVL